MVPKVSSDLQWGFKEKKGVRESLSECRVWDPSTPSMSRVWFLYLNCWALHSYSCQVDLLLDLTFLSRVFWLLGWGMQLVTLSHEARLVSRTQLGQVDREINCEMQTARDLESLLSILNISV